MNSYAAAGEDIILRNIFYNRLNYEKPGFFVDVGAYHPTELSSTMLLYEMGWRGINIDARPGFETAFQEIRSGDININQAVALRKQSMTYHIVEELPQANSLSKKHLEQTGQLEKVTKTIIIETQPLKQLLDENLTADQKIDLINVAVGGMEEEVLKSNDWKKYRPRVVVVKVKEETLSRLQDSRSVQFLENNFYKAIAKTYVNKQQGSVFFIDQL